MPNQIVVIAEKLDLSADAVILRLRDMGQLPVRINVDGGANELEFSLGISGSASLGSIRTRNAEFEPGEIGAVFCRATLDGSSVPGLPDLSGSFARSEAQEAWRGFWAALDCYWMNHPDRIRAMGGRIGQAKLAAALGFEVPRALVTRDPARALTFCHECGDRVVYRALGSPTVLPGGAEGGQDWRVVAPTVIDGEALKQAAGAIALAPCFFQEYVEKKTEVRVTVIGQEVFAVDREAKEPMRSPSWWENPETEVRKAELPEEARNRCRELALRAGLECCVVDLACDGAGRYWFLECNTAGRIAEVEAATADLGMIDRVAACLMRRGA